MRTPSTIGGCILRYLLGFTALASTACGPPSAAKPVAEARSPWTYSDGLKEFPPDSSAQIVTAGYDASGPSHIALTETLTVHCSKAPSAAVPPRWLFVTTPFDASRPGYAVLRLDSMKPDTVTWYVLQVEAAGQTLLEPDQFFNSLTSKLLSRMTRAKRMLFIYSNSGRPDSLTFAIDSLAAEMAKLDAVCGPTR